jgi:pimeloyl-ACP methyl ester carboxylesterase
MYYAAIVLLYWLVIIVAGLLVIGYAYEHIAGQRNRPPGRMVSVNGHRIHLLCKGITGPTVVIEQGAGELSRFWWPMQDQAAKFARVCTYDRAGYGWSDPAKPGRTITDRAEELRMLLLNAGMEAPYLLVAHSYGGLIVRSYAEQHPEEIAGLVLVDTPEESTLFRREVLDFYSKMRTLNRIIGVFAQFGMFRLLRLERYGLGLSRPAEYTALCDDLASLELVPQTDRASKQTGSYGALPVVVITHGKPFPGPFAVLERDWSGGQQRLAALSTNGILMVAANSNHMIQQDEPELVLDAIRRLHHSISTQV